MPAPIPAGLVPGTIFQGRYQIVRCIKAGGMGAVYEVLDEKTASRRALKVMLPSLLFNESLRARFELEAKITGSIESDHLVRVLDAGVDPSSEMPFLVMELLRGEDLATVVQTQGHLSREEVVTYVLQVARALDKTHAANVVHRDLKPDNLFLTFRDDGTPCIKILDFGIAKAMEGQSAGVETRPMMGTPLYMSPEQMRAEKNIGPAADIYALAHIAYALLTGEPYWRPELDESPSPYLLAVEVLQGVQEAPTKRALRRREVDLPEAFDAWFLRGASLKPEERFERASLAAQGLSDALGIARNFRVNTPAYTAVPDREAFSKATTVKVEREAGHMPASEPVPPQSLSAETVPPISGEQNRKAASTPSSPGQRPSGEFPNVRASLPPAPPPASGPARANTSPPSNKSSPGDSSKPAAQNQKMSGALGQTPSGVGLKKKGFHVEHDSKQNILRVKVWGFWTIDDAKAYLEDFKQKATFAIGRPWYVLADISEFAAQKPEVSAFVERTMQFAIEHGMVKAANLVDSALGKMQIARLSQATGLPLFSFFQSEREAIEWLTSSAA